MLEINPEIVWYLIDRAREFHVKESVTFPEEPMNPADDWALQVLADHADDPVLEEFRIAVQDLEPAQQAELVALMWVGRGDFGAAEWGDAVAQARDSWNERTADYLIGTPLVADYLAEGLSELGYTAD